MAHPSTHTTRTIWLTIALVALTAAACTATTGPREDGTPDGSTMSGTDGTVVSGDHGIDDHRDDSGSDVPLDEDDLSDLGDPPVWPAVPRRGEPEPQALQVLELGAWLMPADNASDDPSAPMIVPLNGPGPMATAVIDTIGEGPLAIDVTVRLPGGESWVVAAVEDVRSEGDGPTVLEIGPLPTSEPGTTQIRIDVVEPPGLDGAASRTLVYETRGRPVTPNDCDEIRARYEALWAEREALANECDNLGRELDRAEAERDEKRAALESARDARADAEDALAEAETLFDEEWERVERMLGDAGELVEYGEDGPELDEYDQFIGSGGIGIRFWAVGDLLERFDWVELGTGQKVGAHLRGLREGRERLDQLETALDDAGQAVADAESALAQAEAMVDGLGEARDLCRADVAHLDDELAALEEEEAECLEELAERRRAETALREAETALDDAEEAIDDAADAADEAVRVVGARAGSPEQSARDRADVEAARDAIDDAETERDDARHTLWSARNAFHSGNSAGAIAAARQAAAQANGAATRAQGATATANGVRVRAGLRPERECQDGDMRRVYLGRAEIWDRVVNIQIVPHTSDAVTWAHTLEFAETALDRLNDFIGMVEVAGALGSPIEGTFTPDAGALAGVIVHAYIDLFQRSTRNHVWLLLEGHTRDMSREDVCIDGLWQQGRTYGVDLDDTFTEEWDAGEVGGAGTTEVWEAQIRDVLERFRRRFVGRMTGPR